MSETNKATSTPASIKPQPKPSLIELIGEFPKPGVDPIIKEQQ